MARPLTLGRYEDISEFSAMVGPYLALNEVENSLFLGVMTRIEKGTRPDNLYMATVLDGDRIVMAAFYSGAGLILAGFDEKAIDLIIGDLLKVNLGILGVSSQAQVSKAFASKWAQARNCRVLGIMEQRLYALTEIAPLPIAEGEIAVATEENVEIIGDWLEAFRLEAFSHEKPNREASGKAAETRVQSGLMYLWKVDGRPVSMAALGRPTQNTICVSAVYTPVDQRGKGYATALVAALTAIGLKMGKSKITLFTDLGNPTSNSIYQRIGYLPVCDAWSCGFDYSPE